MKLLFASVSALLFCTMANAQSDHAKAFAAINIGAALSQGDFAAKHTNPDAPILSSSGFAATGFNLDVSAGYRFSNRFGATAMVRTQSNPLETNSIKEEWAKNYPESAVTNASINNWTRTGAMAGLFGVLPLGVEKKAAIDFRAMAGTMKAEMPEQSYSATYNGVQEELHFTSADNSAFAYLLGAAFRVIINPRIALSASADYLASEHNFSNITVTGKQTSPGMITESVSISKGERFTHKLETVTVGLGVAYRFF